MICYVYKVRKGTYVSKKDNKEHHGFNVGLLGLEGSKFALKLLLIKRIILLFLLSRVILGLMDLLRLVLEYRY